MTYYQCSVSPVPTAGKQAYVDHITRIWPMVQKRGALRMVETWGEDVKPGKVTDLRRAVALKDDESVVFSWLEWPDRATADAAMADLKADPTVMAEMGEVSFDCERMIHGGFAPLMAEGTDRGAGWYQGFLVPVPTARKQDYSAMAHSAWDDMFRPNGCTGSVECWGEDVPRGKQTDLYRAVDAKDDESIVFAWTSWPDRETCDAAARAMEESMEGQPMPDMPFDGMRMTWAGFAPLFDSAAR